MNNSIKKYLLFYLLSFLAGSIHLYAAQSVDSSSSQVKNDLPLLGLQSPKMVAPAKPFKQSEIGQKQIKKKPTRDPLPRSVRKQLAKYYCRLYKLPSPLWLIVILFVDDDRLQYSKKELPKDLSNQDLTDFDLTGCKFEGINLTGTILRNVILTNTTCDYGSLLETNFKKIYGRKPSKIHYARYKKLRRALKSITKSYPKLNNHQYKAQLLQIASGLSLLFPDPDPVVFKIQLQYWSYCLRLLKDQLPTEVSQKIYYLLADDFDEDIADYCWTTNYPQDQLTLYQEPPHNDFAPYLTNFENGVRKYGCQSAYEMGFNHYKGAIEENIQGLKKAYPKISKLKKKNYSIFKVQALEREALQIASALSRSYQVGKGAFLYHYLSYQNRLIRLRNLTQLDTICYSPKMINFTQSIWQ